MSRAARGGATRIARPIDRLTCYIPQNLSLKLRVLAARRRERLSTLVVTALARYISEQGQANARRVSP